MHGVVPPQVQDRAFALASTKIIH